MPFFARRRVSPLTIAYFKFLENKKASCYNFGLMYLYDRGIYIVKFMTLPQGLMDGDKYAAKEAHIRKKTNLWLWCPSSPLPN